MSNMTSVCEEVDGLRKENAALKIENEALLQQNKELQQTIDKLKTENETLTSVIDQMSVQASEKPKLLGDMANFSGLLNPEHVSLLAP